MLNKEHKITKFSIIIQETWNSETLIISYFTLCSIFSVRPERLKRFRIGLNEGIQPLRARAPRCRFSNDVIVVAAAAVS